MYGIDLIAGVSLGVMFRQAAEMTVSLQTVPGGNSEKTTQSQHDL